MNDDAANKAHASADQLFFDALEVPPDRRDSFLATSCEKLPNGQSLLIEVKSLLEAHRRAGTFLDEPALISGDLPLPSPHDQANHFIDQHIGPYRIVRRIGVGGMGEVYLAQRDDETFDREVAVKIIRPGLHPNAASEIVNRFAQERRVLAALDHPNIARLIDGGSTPPPDSQPYLIMEYIDGEPIDQYCDARRLSIDQRLDLFLTVCDAVQFAHRNLIVHRDLKPANIFVSHETVKLLDFGIAKVLTPDATDTASLTMTIERRHTPAYASPEQVRPRDNEPITTSSDVYSLGVILYELLTGCKPYASRLTSMKELEDAVCDEPPTRPSAAIASSEIDRCAAARSIDATRLRRRLRGDLETIILKALRKEPERRYASVEQFAEDIRRHRQSMPITARPDTLAYRLGKFVARNQLGVATMLLIVALLVTGLTITTWLYIRSENALQLAADERDRAIEAEARADARFSQVRQLARTMMFDLHDQIQRLPGATAARALLIQTSLEYLDALSREAADDVELLQELAAGYDRLGRVQGHRSASSLGDPAAALESLQRAEGILLHLLSIEPDHDTAPAQLFSLRILIGSMLSSLNRSDEALAMFQSLVPVAEQIRDAQPQSIRARRSVMLAHSFLGNEQLHHGDSDGAMASYLAARDVAEKLYQDHPEHEESFRDVAVMSEKLGNVYLNNMMLDEATEAYLRFLQPLRRRIDAEPSNAQLLSDLGLLYMNLGNVAVAGDDIDSAIERYEQSRQVMLRLVELDSEDATVQRNLSILCEKLGDAEDLRGNVHQSLTHYRQSHAISVKLAQQTPSNANNQISLAWCGANVARQLTATGALAEAEALLVESQQIIRPLAVDQYIFSFVTTADAMINAALAENLLAQSKAAQALAPARRLHEIAQARYELQPDDPPVRPMLARACYLLAAVACETPPARDASDLIGQAQQLLQQVPEERRGHRELGLAERIATLRAACTGSPESSPTLSHN